MPTFGYGESLNNFIQVFSVMLIWNPKNGEILIHTMIKNYTIFCGNNILNPYIIVVNDIYLLSITTMTKKEFMKKMTDNPVFQSIKYYADKYGYVCESACIHYNYPYVNLYRKDRSWEDFHPDIYLETDHLSKENKLKYTWKVGTVSYGSLEGEKLEKYMEAVEDAFNFYKNVKDLDLYLLPTYPEDFDEEN